MIKAAEQLYIRLVELQATATASYLSVSGRRFFVSKLQSTHPFQHMEFFNSVFTQELANFFNTLNYTEATQAVSQCLYWLQQAEQEISYTDEQQALLDSHSVAINVQDGEYFLWSKKNQTISEWNIKAFKERFGKDQWARIKSQTRLSKIAFDPYRGLEKQWEEEHEGQKVSVFNAYRPPLWQTFNYTQEMGRRPEQYPELFMFILNNLIPLPEHQAYVLDWLTLAVFDRCAAYLSLRGVRGNGKTYLMYLCFHLIGNFYNALKKVVTEFNFDLKNKRVIGMNDNPFIGTMEGNLIRKSFTDPIATYNEKGVQTIMSDKQHASMIIASNPSEKFYVTYDDRKIISPLLTDKPMQSWCSQELYDWLRPFEGLGDTFSPAHLQFLKEIGDGLFSRFVQHKPRADLNLKAGHFWGDVLKSLTAFKRYVLMRCLHWQDETGKLEYDIVRSEFAMEPRSGGHIETWHTLKDWVLDDFLWKGEKICINVDLKNKELTINPKVRMQ